jgi:hypothetical protein
MSSRRPTFIVILIDGQGGGCVLSKIPFQPDAISSLLRTTETEANMNKNNIPIYEIPISDRPMIIGRGCIGSNLDIGQARINVRQDFFGDKMTSFAPLRKCERLLPGHGCSSWVDQLPKGEGHNLFTVPNQYTTKLKT